MLKELEGLKKERKNILKRPKSERSNVTNEMLQFNEDRQKGLNIMLNDVFSEKAIKESAYSRLSTRAKTLEDAITHEYGHILNADLQVNNKLYSDSVTKAITKIKVKNDYRVENKGLLHSPKDHFLDKSKDKYFGSVSDYADTNGFEYFAESWLKFIQGMRLQDKDLELLFKLIVI